MKSFILFSCLIGTVACANTIPVSAEETKKEEALNTEEGKTEEGKTEEAQQEVKAQ